MAPGWVFGQNCSRAASKSHVWTRHGTGSSAGQLCWPGHWVTTVTQYMTRFFGNIQLDRFHLSWSSPHSTVTRDKCLHLCFSAVCQQWHGKGVQGEKMLPNFYIGEQPIHFAPPIFTHRVSQFSSELLKTCKLSVIVILHHNRSAINSEVGPILNYIVGVDWQQIQYSVLLR